MKQRSPIAVFLLSLITFGIYGIYWLVVTKEEMKARGADIPTAILIIIPFANIWWMWKYSQGVEMVTGGKLSGIITFLLMWFLGSIGHAIIQDSFNSVAPAGATPTAAEPAMPVAVSESVVAPDASNDQSQTPPTVVGG